MHDLAAKEHDLGLRCELGLSAILYFVTFRRDSKIKFEIGEVNKSKKSQCVTEGKSARQKLQGDIAKLISRVLPISQINATVTENKQVRREMKRLPLSTSTDVLQIWFTTVHAHSSRKLFFCGRFYCPRFLQKTKCLRFGKAINCFGETNPALTKEPLKSLITETVV